MKKVSSLILMKNKQKQPYPSEIIFWVKVLGFPLEFWAAPTFERIGEALGEWLEVDLDHGRIKVKVDGYKRLCFETSVDFRGGEFHDREEALISLRYEKRRLITSLCRISVSSLLFVGSLVLVSFYPKFMNWNKDGLVGFYICCVVALLRRNFMCLGAYWCNLCFTGIYKSTGLYLVCWNILASLFIMKQILYLVSLNQVQLQSRCCELQCANWFQGDCRLSSSKIQDKGFTFFQIFSVIKGLTSSLNLDWAVRYSTVSLAIWRLPRQSQVRILDLEKNYVLELLNVKVFTELTECDFKVISRVGKENRTSGGILILVLNKVGLCALMRSSFYSNEAFFTNYGDTVVLVRGLRTYFNNTGVTGSLVVSFLGYLLWAMKNCSSLRNYNKGLGKYGKNELNYIGHVCGFMASWIRQRRFSYNVYI